MFIVLVYYFLKSSVDGQSLILIWNMESNFWLIRYAKTLKLNFRCTKVTIDLLNINVFVQCTGMGYV